MAKSGSGGRKVSCENCFFGVNQLCALGLGEPCPTYRPAERGLAPERQLAFVFRTARTRSAYAFPPPAPAQPAPAH